MSEKVTSSLSLPELLSQRRKRDNLTRAHMTFLLNWFETFRPKMFGFQGVRKIEDQLTQAIKLLKAAEVDWEKRMRDNKTSLSFPQFFFYTALSQGLQIPPDFEAKYLTLTKGDSHEYQRS